jgi:hypothetical protein
MKMQIAQGLYAHCAWPGLACIDAMRIRHFNLAAVVAMMRHQTTARTGL